MPPDGVIVIHAALLAAVQAQPAPAVTPTLPLPPEAETEVLAGDIEYVHPSAWFTVNVCPAIVAVPVRAAPVLAATE